MSNDNQQAVPPQQVAQIMAQMQAAAMAQRIAHDTFNTLAADGEDGAMFKRANELATKAFELLMPDGELRVVTMAALASIVASFANGVTTQDLTDEGKAHSVDVIIMSVGMMAQHLLRVHANMHAEAAAALNAAVSSDKSRAN